MIVHSTVERLFHWNADELVILDISRGEVRHDLRRDELHQQYASDNANRRLREIAKCSCMPLTFSGRRSLAEARGRRRQGHDQQRGPRRSSLIVGALACNTSSAPSMHCSIRMVATRRSRMVGGAQRP